MSDNQAIVKDFIAAFNANDLERIMTFFTPDCVYHNIPLEPATGLEAIRGVLAGFSGMSKEVDWVLHNIAENSEGVVLTERTDRFLIGEKWAEAPVMGVFEIEGDKIKAWRDYFDLAQFSSEMGG